MTIIETNQNRATMTELILVVGRDGIIECVSDPSHPLLLESYSTVECQVDFATALSDEDLAEILEKQQLATIEYGSLDVIQKTTLSCGPNSTVHLQISSQLMTANARSNIVLHKVGVISESEKGIPEQVTPAGGTGQRRTELLSALQEITVRLMDQQPMQGLLQTVADSILKLTEADSSYINLASPDGEYLELVAVAGDNKTSVGYKTHRGQGLSGKTLESGQLEYSSSYNKIRNRIKAFDKAKQACAIPLKGGDRLVGVLGFVMDTEAESLFAQIDVVKQFATLASIAINNSMLMEETREELKRTQSMNMLSSAVFENDSFDELLQVTMRTIKDVAKAGNVEAWSIKGSQNIHLISSISECGSGASEQAEGTRSQLRQWYYSDRGTERADKVVYPGKDNINASDCIIMPCTIDDSTDIAFRICHQNARNLSQNVRHLLAGIAKQFSTAVSRQMLQKKVAHQAFHDGLTALPNRVKFDGLLKDALRNGVDNSVEFSVLFIDLDGFKTVNDTHGHDIGDKFLVEVASRFQASMSEHCVLARVGGDEFAVIVKQNCAEIRQVGEALLDSLDANLRHEYGIPEIGASIGVAHFPADGISSYHLLRKADMAMYHSKRNGKNQVVLYKEIESNEQDEVGSMARRKVA